MCDGSQARAELEHCVVLDCVKRRMVNVSMPGAGGSELDNSLKVRLGGMAMGAKSGDVVASASTKDKTEFTTANTSTSGRTASTIAAPSTPGFYSKRLASQRFRQRKLSVKQALPVFTQSESLAIDLGLDEHEVSRHIPKVETGVEKAEEVEHHLQAVLSASLVDGGTKVSNLCIPTPDTKLSSLQYDALYSQRFALPITYIHFSSTLEDCIGPPYCMTSDDEIFLRNFNAHASSSGNTCSAVCFEKIISAFDALSNIKQPKAAADPTLRVLTYEKLVSGEDADELLDASAREFAPQIYPYWKSLRVKRQNRDILPTIRFGGVEVTDDQDPYVCFRRRELRQIRKTRGRDGIVAERLRNLRVELEQARRILHLIHQREIALKNQLKLDKVIFKQRHAFKLCKRKLSQMKVETDDNGSDINLLVSLPQYHGHGKWGSKIETLTGGRLQQDGSGHAAYKSALMSSSGSNGSRSSLSSTGSGGGSDRDGAGKLGGSVASQGSGVPRGRDSGGDLKCYEDLLAQRKDAIKHYIENGMEKLTMWNRGWVDRTWDSIVGPLTVKQGGEVSNEFFRVIPGSSSPPWSDSTSQQESNDGDAMEVDNGECTKPSAWVVDDRVRGSDNLNSGVANVECLLGSGVRTSGMYFRRRMGRGGRVFLDRRLTRKRTSVQSGQLTNKWKEENYNDQLITSDPFVLDAAMCDRENDADLDVKRIGDMMVAVGMQDMDNNVQRLLRWNDRQAYDQDSDDDERVMGFNIIYKDMHSDDALQLRSRFSAELARQLQVSRAVSSVKASTETASSMPPTSSASNNT